MISVTTQHLVRHEIHTDQFHLLVNDSYLSVIQAAPLGDHMSVPMDAIPDLIVGLRAALDLWERYNRKVAS